MGCINDKNLTAKSKRQHIHSKFATSPNPMYHFVSHTVSVLLNNGTLILLSSVGMIINLI